MTDKKEKANAIIGTTKLTIKIRNLETTDAIAKQIVETAGLAEKVSRIDIVTEEDEDDDEPTVDSTTNATDKKNNEDESTNADDKAVDQKIDPKPLATTAERIAAREAAEEAGTLLAASQCEPLIQILSTILSRQGSLTHFSWQGYCFGWYTRPHTFWDALFSHSNSLESLQLSYFEHEVDQVPAPKTTFPKLERLKLNTVSAHGDNGTGIDALLQASSGPASVLRELDFVWPGCDLDGCQIQNISWDYTYPSLTHLTLSGYNFAAAPLAAFLSRHPTVEAFADGIDYYEEGDSSEPEKLRVGVLPNLKALDKSSYSLNNVLSYFEPEAQRPIRHLTLSVSAYGGGKVLSELVTLPRVKAQLKVLELHGNITAWREEEEDTDSSETEEEKKGADKTPHQLPRRMPDVLQECLGGLEALQELGVSLESGEIWHRRKDGVFGCPDPATAEDLRYLLTHVPHATRIRALRIWDEKAKPLPQDVLDDFPPVPESLEYLAWEGEEKTLYRVEREGGKIRAVVCEGVREKKVDEKEGEGNSGVWTEGRILDY